jgi:pimeloyl-ACP methyl ester carboxylesterase
MFRSAHVIVPNAGHFAQVHNPEGFSQAVVDFLAGL